MNYLSRVLHITPKPLINDDFDKWITFIFDHPVTSLTRNWCIDVGLPELGASRIVAYLTHIFKYADAVLQPFSDAQVDHGFDLLIHEYTFALGEQTVPLLERLRCIRAMKTLFTRYFAVRCTAHLSHLNEGTNNPLNGICYMWWDILFFAGLGLHGTSRSNGDAIDRACLSVMENTLRLPSVACQESALHGLGHWNLPAGAATVDRFLERNRDLRPELRSYAEAARWGYVQ